MGGDKLGDCCDTVFFFLRSGDDNVRVWGVSSSFASKFEGRVWLLFFVRGSVGGPPAASVLGSFFVKDAKTVSNWCWSFDDKSVLLGMRTPPL